MGNKIHILKCFFHFCSPHPVPPLTYPPNCKQSALMGNIHVENWFSPQKVLWLQWRHPRELACQNVDVLIEDLHHRHHRWCLHLLDSVYAHLISRDISWDNIHKGLGLLEWKVLYKQKCLPLAKGNLHCIHHLVIKTLICTVFLIQKEFSRLLFHEIPFNISVKDTYNHGGHIRGGPALGITPPCHCHQAHELLYPEPLLTFHRCDDAALKKLCPRWFCLGEESGLQRHK